MENSELIEAKKLIRDLTDVVTSKEAYIKALEKQCQLAHELVAQQKSKIDALQKDLINVIAA